jgi:hypothetical protein
VCQLRGTCDHYSAEQLRIAKAAPAPAAPAAEPYLPDTDVLRAIGLQPECYITEAGSLNGNKLRATIMHPEDYLPADHWLRLAKFMREQPAAEPVAWRVRSISRVTREPGAWRYYDEPERLAVNSPKDYQFELLYTAPQRLTEEQVARLFHETYERLAPEFGYETRPHTREFNPDSDNGRLMIAVCGEVLQRIGR